MMIYGMMVTGMLRRLYYRLQILVRRFGLGALLVLAIIVSLILSIGLWQAPERNIKSVTRVDATKQLVAAKPLTDLYNFNQLMINEADGQQYMVIDYRPMVDKMTKRLRDWQLAFTDQKVLSKKAYVASLKTKNMFVLALPDAVPGAVLREMLHNHADLPTNAQINRVRIPRDKPTSVWFYDDQQQRVYHYAVKHAGQTMRVFKRPSTAVLATYRMNTAHQIVTDTLASVSLRTYSYLMEAQPTNNYLSVLFRGRETPAATRIDNEVTYSDGSTRQLKLNTMTGVASFNDYGVVGAHKTFNQRIQQGYKWLLHARQLPNNVYYFENQAQGRQLTYRLYVDGLPIFNQTTYGTVQIKQYDNRHQQIDFSQYTLQVPLPSDDKAKVDLVPSATAYKQLAAVGVSADKIENISYGYRWVSDTTENVVTLSPEWYVEINKSWNAVSDVIAMRQGGY